MTEYERAKQWRERLGLTPAQLSELTGYATATLYWYERGETPRSSGSGHPGGTPPAQYAWHRFKLCCEAIERRRGELASSQPFNW